MAFIANDATEASVNHIRLGIVCILKMLLWWNNTKTVRLVVQLLGGYNTSPPGSSKFCSLGRSTSA